MPTQGPPAAPIPAYVGVDGKTYRKLIEPASITITRAEGPTERCGKPHTCTRWSEAYAILRAEAATAPKCGAYDKHDFTVTFADGFEYRGRYDLKHWSAGNIDLAAHCYAFLKWLATSDLPDTPTDATGQTKHALQTYDFNQGPIPVPEGTSVAIIRDYWTNPLTLEETLIT